MRTGPERLAELRSLLDALCEGSSTPDQVARIESLVLHDPEAEAFYIHYMQVHGALVREFGNRATGTLAVGDGPGAHAEAARAPGPSGAGREPRRPWGGRRSRSLAWAAAAVVAAAVGSLAVGIIRAPEPVVPGRRDARPSARAYPRVGFADGLVMVVKLEGVEWEDDGQPHPSERDLVPASGRLRFRSGRATLAMLTGVGLVVEGPADLEFVSSDKVLCHRGRLRARVPRGAEGFVVSGPGSAMLDLGTEFGMNVSPDGRTRGKVFEGRVEAAELNEAGTFRRSRMLKGRSPSFEIDPRAGFIERDPGPEDFLSPSNPPAPPLVLAAGYRDAVLESRPWGYWRFESLDGGTTPNEVAGRPPLRIHGEIGLSAPAGDNRSAVFERHEGAVQYLALDELVEPASHPGFAVELWCLPEGISHAALMSMTAPRDSGSHQFLLELTSRERWTLHQPASVRFLHRAPPRTEGGDNLYSDGLYAPYRWCHVVGQMNGDRMELFMDGEPTPPLSVAPDMPIRASQFLLGRLTTVPRSTDTWSRPFVGRLDEVALYHHPLTVEEVRRHYRLGSVRAAGGDGAGPPAHP